MTQETTNMAKKKFRIGDLARELNVKKFVIRFWEKEFELQSDRSQGGQRFYTNDDLKAFNTIKNLLYHQGYTIAGAKVQLAAILKQKPAEAPTQITPATHAPESIQTTTVQTIEKQVPYIPQDFLEKVNNLKQKLMNLKEQLEQN